MTSNATDHDVAPEDEHGDAECTSDDEWLAVLECTHASVRAYARVEFEALARKVIHRLQRVAAYGIYGDDYVYKTLWDEYCHEVQEGPSLLEDAWNQTVPDFIDDAIERIPRHAAVLLSIAAAWELAELDEAQLVGSYWPDGIRRIVNDQMATIAGARHLDRFRPWRNW